MKDKGYASIYELRETYNFIKRLIARLKEGSVKVSLSPEEQKEFGQQLENELQEVVK